MITIIVAHDENRVIGYQNQIPWHISEDLKLFKRYTLTNTVIMGRKTWESLPIKPLPDRNNIVISNTLSDDRCIIASSLDDALTKAEALGKSVYIIGGATVYEEAIDKATLISLSLVHGEYEGDVYFPILGDEWIYEKIKEYNDFTHWIIRRKADGSH